MMRNLLYPAGGSSRH